MNSDSKALISDLIQIAKADGKVTASEYDFIVSLALKMDVTEEEVKILFENPLPSKKLLSELERITHFYKLILTMNIDNETHKKELVAVRNFGLKMGVRQGVVDQMLVKMNEYENKIIPSNEILKIFNTYYN
ncbi:hypothetical protein [Patiriisocius sp. Uisw_017]|jgi:uncharacterized tellurite resistance protein B-like protein|uniref:tellurite resistance TerB family protein n=1 Tax=Patiriisocius sp. Uisw_017 TaxID=3230968 RepID=UPI0039E84F3B